MRWPTNRFTEWRPGGGFWRLGGHRRAAIGELIVGCRSYVAIGEHGVFSSDHDPLGYRL